MKKVTRVIAGLVLMSATFSGCTDSSNSNSRVVNSNSTNMNSNAARTNQTSSGSADLGQVLASTSVSVDDRVKAIDIYVSEVEAKLPSLTRKEILLKPDDLKGVTEANVSRVHAYSDGPTLRRIKIYPTGTSQKTEEFYLYNDKLVFVFIEAQGAGKQGDNPTAKGDKLYFGNEGLTAWYGEDGKAKDPSSSEFKKMGEKLMSEIVAFRNLAGRS